MRRINRCLNKQLADLYQQAIQLDELNHQLALYLPPTLRTGCSIGSFIKGCLVIVASNAGVATELRYYLPTLRDQLRKEAGLYQLLSIKVQMVTTLSPHITTTNRKASTSHQLSSLARNAARNASDLCTYPPLKDALLRLANSDKSAE